MPTVIPGTATLENAVTALRDGDVIACPTEAVWGLSCNPHNPSALTRLLRMKTRAPAKGLIVVAADIDQLTAWLAGLDYRLYAPLLASWPGPVTWLVPDNGTAHALVRGDHATVALRVTDHPGMQALCRAFGGPLVSTSANRAGEPPAMSAAEAGALFATDQRDEPAVVLAGELGGHERPSSIRDLASGRVLRD
ncbi:L-threonylcarbamoyladenylate synthase [Vreelandella jeotgali]|uniref:L-threonylcarbamoyladenylate synthase n=1 Tax=Vreelandella jeotgali TaxID=553386 RepID=UPI000349673F|nr:Sua5/YciO/YrdC/YwlC family protein [Halomonas jeotgali]